MLANFEVEPGLFTEETPRGAKRRWKDGNHVRWRDKLPEKLGGWVSYLLSDPLSARVVGYPAGKIIGTVRSVHDWSSLDGTGWVSVGTEFKLYLINNYRLYDITPLRVTHAAIMNPITTTLGSAEVVVNDPGHGAQDNDFVTISGATAVGGITLAGNYQITDIIDLNNYKVVHSSPASSGATGGGSVTFAYEIAVGAAAGQTTTGYGSLGYGTLEYGFPRPVGAVSAFLQLRIWSLDNWGEDLIASPRSGAIYVWERSTGPTTRAVWIPTAPVAANRILVDASSRILVDFGAYDDAGGFQDQLLIRWSDSEDYTTWLASAINNAGQLRLNSGSRILTAIPSRLETLVFTDITLYSFRFVGGDDVFSITPLANNVNLVGPNAVAVVNGVAFYMGSRDFHIYDGVARVLPCDIRTKVFSDINQTSLEKVYAHVNAKYTEIWWNYPSMGSTENDRYAVYNYKDNVWYYGTMDRSAMHAYSSIFQTTYGFRQSDGILAVHEIGSNDIASNGDYISLDSFLESFDSEVEASGDHTLHIGKMIPDFQRFVGSGLLYLKSRKYPQSDELVTKGPYAFDGSTNKIDVRTRNRQVAIRLEFNNQINCDWRMGTWRVDGKPHGTRV